MMISIRTFDSILHGKWDATKINVFFITRFFPRIIIVVKLVIWTRLYFKEKVEFWEEVNNNLRALSLFYASVEEHEIKNVP